MYLLCRKCLLPLTEKLVKVEQINAYAPSELVGDKYTSKSVLSGVYFHTDDSRVVVGEASVLSGVISGDSSDHGCCNFSGGFNLKCPQCNATLAEMFLDCYEYKEVKFLASSVSMDD